MAANIEASKITRTLHPPISSLDQRVPCHRLITQEDEEREGGDYGSTLALGGGGARRAFFESIRLALAQPK